MAYVPGFDCDLYISCASVDRDQRMAEFVQELAIDLDQRLGRLGKLLVFSDTVNGPTDWEKKGAGTAESAAILVPFLSPHYASSEYCAKEWELFRSKWPLWEDGTKDKVYRVCPVVLSALDEDSLSRIAPEILAAPEEPNISAAEFGAKIAEKLSAMRRNRQTVEVHDPEPLAEEISEGAQPLTGHSDVVFGVAVTPDGKQAVSASGDKTLILWDLETGGVLRTLQGHSAAVYGVAVMREGSRAVSASGDKTLKIWDLETGRALSTMKGHSGRVSDVAVTPDGKRAVSASGDKTLKIWDLETGRATHTLAGHSDSVYGVAVTPDGRLAVSASRDKTLKVWDLKTGHAMRTLEGHSDRVSGAAVTPDGKRVVSASWDKTLRVWDLQTGRTLRTLEGHSAQVRGVALTADGKLAISASDDKTLKVWDLETGVRLRTLEGHSQPVLRVAVTPDGTMAVSASEDNNLNVWDVESGRDLRTLQGHPHSAPAAGAPDSLSGADAADVVAVAYRTTYPAFEGDLVGFDQRSFKEPLRDALGADVFAGHLAQLIAARSTPLPLSLGLFGDWGAGKSFFMRLLHQKIDELAARKDDNIFCRKVVQIHFNAWHYVDTNLWANLVSEIFDNLFASLEQKSDTKEMVEALKKKLAEESALAAEAKKELAAATQARDDAEVEWLRSAQKRKQAEASLSTYFDDLTKLVLEDKTTQKALKDLSDGLGLTRLSESFSDLETNAIEARTLAGRFRTLALSVLSPKGLARRLSLLLAAIVVPVVVASVVPRLLNIANEDWAALTRNIAAAVTLIGAVSAWVSVQTKRGAVLVGKLEGAYARVKELRSQKMIGSTEQRDLNKQIKSEAAASEKLRLSQEKVRALESELRDLSPGRRLLQFLEQRAGANDYRQYLGLVSVVRRDFEHLSHLLKEGADPGGSDEPLLDRIVLYIDDLDRCKSERVIELLEAVHLLLAFPIFAVVVAVDPRWLRQSLIEHYPTLLSDGRKLELHLSVDGVEGPASPQDYLEKIFQVPFQIQPIKEEGFKKLVAELVKVAPQPVLVSSAPADGPLPEPVSLPVPAALPVAPATPQEEEVKAPGPTPVMEATSDGVTPIPPKPLKLPDPVQVAPARLQFEEWEQIAITECHPLFRTPRAVKRLVNTYCLIRVGVDAAGWVQFLGSKEKPKAEYRTPLLMMAVAAAYPGVARQWLHAVVMETTWIIGETGSNTGSNPGNGNLVNREIDQMGVALRQMNANDFAPFDHDLVQKWAPTVQRYFF